MGPYNRPEDEEVMNLVHLYGASINTKSYHASLYWIAKQESDTCLFIHTCNLKFYIDMNWLFIISCSIFVELVLKKVFANNKILSKEYMKGVVLKKKKSIHLDAK